MGMEAATVSKTSRMPSMAEEWKAWDVRRKIPAPPAHSSASRACSRIFSGPESTQLDRLLTTTVSIRSRRGPRARLNFSRGSRAASILPSGACCIRAPRFVTSRAASTGVNTPAKQAAAISPKLCPSRHAGRTPASSSRVARESSRAKRTGCIMSVRVMRSKEPGSSSQLSRSRLRMSGPPAARICLRFSASSSRKRGFCR